MCRRISKDDLYHPPLAPEPPPGQVQVQELRRTGSKERGRGLLTPAGLGTWWRPPAGGRRRVSSSSSSCRGLLCTVETGLQQSVGPVLSRALLRISRAGGFLCEGSRVMWKLVRFCGHTVQPPALLLALVTRLLLQDPLPTLRTPEQGSPRHEV